MGNSFKRSHGMAVVAALWLINFGTELKVQSAGDAPVRVERRIESAWRFHAGDIPMPVVASGDTYGSTKAGSARGAASIEFDDSLWPTVDLPHDWALTTPFSKDNNRDQGFHSRGIGWYRRAFKLDPSSHGKHLELQFDGVATNCTLWVNGIIAARNFCGYTSFSVDITPFARYGNDVNQIAVRVDADQLEGWWYEGAGIYRHVQIVEQNPVHIATDGVYANPVRDAAGKWSVPVEVTLDSSAKMSQNTTVEVSLLDKQGHEVAKMQGEATAAPYASPVIKMAIPVESPELWSVDSPTLYTVRTTLKDKDSGAVLDRTQQRCGFRTLRFDKDQGFFLNDQPLKIKGTCNHQDAAGIGVAVPDSIWAWRLKRLKEMGSNAYRCAHNPPAKEFLEAADEIGMLVLDENRNFNTTPEYVRQLQWLVRRDRNHPSVFLWSVFNEEPMQGTEAGYEMVRKMSAAVKELDTTRPVTAAISGGLLNDVGVAHAVDVVGFNYQNGSYDSFHKKFPNLPMTSSEDTSAVQTRGEYVTDKKGKFIIDAYDDQAQPWGRTHRIAWKEIDTRPFLAGGFVWTGFDYRGEPQPLEWPATGSSFGIMDQCGFPKTAYYIHQAHWIKDRPILHIAPHWNWAGREGQNIKVMVISNAQQAELFLNGKSLGRKPIDPYMMVDWQVPYAPGAVEAVAFDAAGKEIAREKVETTGDAVALRLVPDRDAMAGDGQDAQPIDVQAIDEQGRVVPTVKPLAVFRVDGPANILGVANGDPICHELDKADRRTLYNGLAQLTIQSRAGGSGNVTVTASADNLKPATAKITLTAAPAPVSIPAVADRAMLVRRWRMSPASDTKLEPSLKPGATDMNTWTNVESGRVQTLSGGRFALMRTVIRPRATVQSTGGTIVLEKVIGKAAVYIDGTLAIEKAEIAPATLRVPLPPGQNERTLAIIFEAADDLRVGLGGPASIEPASTTEPTN